MSVLLLWSPYFYSVSVKLTIHVFEEKVVAGRSVEVPDEVLLGLTISAFSALDSASVQKIAIVISHLLNFTCRAVLAGSLKKFSLVKAIVIK